MRVDDRRKGPDYFMERDGERFAGLHVFVDLKGASRLNEIGHIEAVLRDCIEATGATLLHIHLHHFSPGGGVSGVAVLAESHISIHTWPEAEFAAVDIFMCGETFPERVVPVLQTAFSPVDMQAARAGSPRNCTTPMGCTPDIPPPGSSMKTIPGSSIWWCSTPTVLAVFLCSTARYSSPPPMNSSITK